MAFGSNSALRDLLKVVSDPEAIKAKLDEIESKQAQAIQAQNVAKERLAEVEQREAALAEKEADLAQREARLLPIAQKISAINAELANQPFN